MSAGGITEFLNELSESEALAALRNAHSTRSPLVFKLENADQHIKAYINTFADKKIILTPEEKVIKKS